MGNTGSVLSWLHLSDFHFDAKEGWDRRRTTRALLEYLGERKKNGWSPDLVFATGDFADKGRKEELDQAILFFNRLAEVLQIDLAQQLFVVPGNHDVDRSAIKPGQKAVIAEILGLEGNAQQERIAETLRDSETLRFLGGRLAQYYAFTERLFGPARRTSEDRPWRVDIREIRGLTVAVLQLNSAWASADNNDKGRLLVGAHQLDEALAESAGARVRFALVHHPPDYLADGDASRFRGALQATGGAHFVLRGHLHENDLELSIDPSGSTVRLAAGAVYQGTDWPKRFQIGEIDLGRGQGRIELLTYSDRERGFWTIDAMSYRQLPDGIYEFSLPGHRTKGGSGTRARPGEKKARQTILFASYRKAVAAVHGQMKFIGFPSTAIGSKPNVGVAELFVPLRLAAQGKTNPAASLSTHDLVRRLGASGKKPERFVILGEPGSGKTTLCRFVAAALAGQDAASRFLGDETPKVLPLFLPFRDYLHRRRSADDCGILEFLVEQAKNHLQVGAISPDFFMEALEAGRAVLLLDGLDEVGRPEERVETRDRVLAFCSLYPLLSLVVTSRFAGYEDAPLAANEFHHLQIEAFDEEDLRQFVDNWYAVQEPNDPPARERGRTDLLAALQTEPRVRALAGNPLLATLIALVHRTEAKLPGERAKLYDLLARTLLETWPEQAKRQFLEIDPDLQRSYLEDFALDRQKKRAERDTQVTFTKEELVSGLAKIHGRREQSMPVAQLRRLAERWLEHLAAGTGIVVEQRSGVFTFLHLSLLEFLAARALLRQEQPLEEAIQHYVGHPVWREVLLLAVGSSATDAKLLDRVFRRLKTSGQWFFLLLCLREEAAFDDESRTEILDGAALLLLETASRAWQSTQETLAILERFSVRHSQAAREWRRARFSTSRGDALLAAVATSRDWLVDLQWLDRREDRQQAAADLLEFWPGSPIGEWAIGRVSAELLRERLASGANELAMVRALTSLGGKGQLTAAAAAGQLRAARQAVRMAGTARTKLKGRRGGKSLPAKISVMSGDLILATDPQWPRVVREHEDLEWASITLEFPQEFIRNYTRDFARYAIHEFNRIFPRESARKLTRKLVIECARDLARDFARDYNLDFIDFFDRDHDLTFVREFAWKFARNFARSFEQYSGNFAEEFALDFSTGISSRSTQRAGTRERPYGTNQGIEDPASGATARDRLDLRSFLAEPTSEKKWKAAGRALTARRAAEAWIALATTVRSSRGEAAVCLGHRLENVALLFLWQSVDDHLPTEPAPEQLALYLQLGWTQSTTTHEWPATERWIALMKAGPPAHWLPRSQWHLCWLLHDPSALEHQRAFNGALREGLADIDDSRRFWAVTLERVIGFYPEDDPISSA